jgi:hypothetical protein
MADLASDVFSHSLSQLTGAAFVSHVQYFALERPVIVQDAIHQTFPPHHFIRTSLRRVTCRILLSQEGGVGCPTNAAS